MNIRFNIDTGRANALPVSSYSIVIGISKRKSYQEIFTLYLSVFPDLVPT